MNRIKELREALGMTQEKFSERIGLARNSVANYEIGRRAPTNAVLVSICREFNVNENWIRTGEGEIFNEEVISLDEYAKQNNFDETEIEIIKVIMSIPKVEREKIINKMKDIFMKPVMKESLPDEQTSKKINLIMGNYEGVTEASKEELTAAIESKLIKKIPDRPSVDEAII